MRLAPSSLGAAVLRSLALDCGPSSRLVETLVNVDTPAGVNSIVEAIVSDGGKLLKELLLPENGEGGRGSYLIQAVLDAVSEADCAAKILTPVLLLVGKFGWESGVAVANKEEKEEKEEKDKEIQNPKIHSAVLWKSLALAGRTGPHTSLLPRIINALQGGSGLNNLAVEDLLLCLLLKTSSGAQSGAQSHALAIDMCGAKAFSSLFRPHPTLTTSPWKESFLVKLANSPLFTLELKKDETRYTKRQLNQLLVNALTNGGLARSIIDVVLDLTVDGDGDEDGKTPHAAAINLACLIGSHGTSYDYSFEQGSQVDVGDGEKEGLNLVSFSCTPVGAKLLKKIVKILVSAGNEKGGKDIATGIAHVLSGKGSARLQGDKFGRVVFEECGVHAFEEGVEEWNKFCKKVVRETSFVSEIIVTKAENGSGNGNGNGGEGGGRKRKRKRKGKGKRKRKREGKRKKTQQTRKTIIN